MGLWLPSIACATEAWRDIQQGYEIIALRPCSDPHEKGEVSPPHDIPFRRS